MPDESPQFDSRATTLADQSSQTPAASDQASGSNPNQTTPPPRARQIHLAHVQVLMFVFTGRKALEAAKRAARTLGSPGPSSGSKF
ncbi:uncharacterized protein I303_100555 [Kwoniella dejecticola CBS 10117]|uniref:Uncharacterized protein n=1 Tax=Kwoniella dejecticola CBS 10117 TaxID=1296121 RepID=A0A1A6AFB2_9TREE|nr:uncharacterized protein I303_00556 [Kwoniella dejecticola CBS 10117]OBR88739.1 hypothetical protein I303_00556 [Kwoniella dejecticola CBS 10117]